MRLHAAIAISGAAALAQQAAPLHGQIYKGGGPILVANPDPARVEEMLSSTPDCRRHQTPYNDVAQELNAVTRNPACRNYKPLGPPCPANRVWIHKYTLPIATPLWAGYAPHIFTVAEQNGMIDKARTAAASIVGPSGSRLYRLTYLTKSVGMGPHPTQRVMGEAHFGVCGTAHP